MGIPLLKYEIFLPSVLLMAHSCKSGACFDWMGISY